MSDHSAELLAKLNQIKQEYLQNLKDEWLGGLEAFRAIPLTGWDKQALEKLLFHAHSVSGSGATFGYALLSEHARKLEEFARDLSRQSVQASDQDHLTITGLIDRLSDTCREALKDINPA